MRRRGVLISGILKEGFPVSGASFQLRHICAHNASDGLAVKNGPFWGALVSGPDGLECYREIIAGAPAHLEAGGLLALEHGYAQGAAVRALLAEAGFTGVATHRDLAGHERVTSGVGREGGLEGLSSFTEFKSVLLDT